MRIRFNTARWTRRATSFLPNTGLSFVIELAAALQLNFHTKCIYDLLILVVKFILQSMNTRLNLLTIIP